MGLNIFKRKPPSEVLADQGSEDARGSGFCKAEDERPCITVCGPAAGEGCGCEEVRRALEAEISARGLELPVHSMKVGCNGTCPYGPLVGFPQRGFFYHRLEPQRAREVVAETLVKGHILFDLLHIDRLKSTSGRILYDRGSGFIATIDDRFCMVQVARYFLEFDRGVSCGKCVPCRVGSVRLREIIDGIIQGNGQPEDIELLHLICDAMREAAYCDFGKTTSDPVRSILKHFRSEFEAHIEQRLCPAGVCPGLTGKPESE
jgi:(2Fe-2S) ferredoxin